MSDTLNHILKKYHIRLQPDTEHRKNGQTMPLDLNITREALAMLFKELGFKSGAEIGVEQGEYSEVLAKANPDATLYLVDAWRRYSAYRDHVSQDKLEGFFERTKERVAAYPNVKILRNWSVEAARGFKDGELDWVFIDANHSFNFVINDIIEWARVVRKDGIVAGHDFFVGSQGHHHQVPIAVRAYTEAHGIMPWFCCRGDHSPSWFFVKP